MDAHANLKKGLQAGTGKFKTMALGWSTSLFFLSTWARLPKYIFLLVGVGFTGSALPFLAYLYAGTHFIFSPVKGVQCWVRVLLRNSTQ